MTEVLNQCCVVFGEKQRHKELLLLHMSVCYWYMWLTIVQQSLAVGRLLF